MSEYLNIVATDRCKHSFSKVFSYFAPRLRSYALKQMGNEALAMELVQDTMTNVWQKSHLFNSEKGSPSTTLGQRMGVESTSLSRTLTSMEENGLIVRKPNPEDGRSVLICLTEEGRDKRN